MTELLLDGAASRVLIHTFAEGLFARLAHDLELVCGELSGKATREGEGGTAEITAPLGAMSVVGVVAKGRVDESVLSASDRADIVEKMKKDVFQASSGAEVRVSAKLEGGSARVTLTPPNERAASATTRVTTSDAEGSLTVRGRFEVSLAAIGSPPVKGPMGAFRVKDAVEIVFDLVFRAQPA